ncbi:GNAT family N-acetyltransferase [Streptomyces oceani]|uniref:GNAT family N-acetyltransferase n=1 Tax=Streptomyces oceani TaxID=1075402 RepID=UPI000871E99F|nr:GNAT family N-acetyltransferase [Streptomyces oceani]
MEITIRTARPREFADISELTEQVYVGDGLLTYGAADPYLARLRDTAGRAEHSEIVVAVREEDVTDASATDASARAGQLVLGAVTFVPEGGKWAQVAGPDEAEFRMLVVGRAARGRGVGESLVRECLARARERGLARVVLSSDPLMKTAHRLYERLGFRRTPTRDWEPIPGHALWTFAVELPPPGSGRPHTEERAAEVRRR